MMKTLVAAMATVAMLSIATPVGAIVNGQPDTTHDYVGAMRGFDPGGTQRLCSGSLIANGVFLTAAHCVGLTGIRVLEGILQGRQPGISWMRTLHWLFELHLVAKEY